MSIFDLLGLDLEGILSFLQRWHINVSREDIQGACDIIIWGLIAIASIRFLLWLWKFLFYCNRKRKSDYIHDNLDHDFKDYLGKINKMQYIETHFLSCPPHDYDEPNKATTASTRESMTSFCGRILNESNHNERLYMILAGSGMGKTTFMVNMFCHYINKKMTRKGLPFDIRLLRLDDENVIEKIQAIAKSSSITANKTILLLDALDENRHASEDFKRFQSELEAVIEPFKLVMITCRSQFFDSEKLVPEDTAWMSTGREKNLINYNKIYISPFSDEDISQYLSIKYKRQWKKRKQALLIVDKCKNLMVRPLLLSYIDDLIENNAKYTGLSDIYEKLIDKWLQREVNRIQDKEERQKQKSNLYRFSSDIAKTIYSNWKDIKSMQLAPEQMTSFMLTYGYDDIPFDVKRRSLINRNASGSFKFAHKSFLEFFLAKEFFEKSSFDLEFEGMDMAKKVYQEMCINEYKRIEEKGYIETLTFHKFKHRVKLCIKNATSITPVNYIHILEALKALGSNPQTVSFLWKDFSDDLYNFLDNLKVFNLEVKGYKNISNISPKSLLKISSLSLVSFESSEESSLSNRYINNARKLGVATVYNGDIITTGTQISRFPITLNVEYQSHRRLLQLFDDNMKISRDLLDLIFNENENK